MKSFIFSILFIFLFSFSSFAISTDGGSGGGSNSGFLVATAYCSSAHTQVSYYEIAPFLNRVGNRACASHSVYIVNMNSCPDGSSIDIVYTSSPIGVDVDTSTYKLTYNGVTFDQSLCSGGTNDNGSAGGGTNDNGSAGGGTNDNGSAGGSIATENTQQKILNSVNKLNNTLNPSSGSLPSHNPLSSGDFDTSIPSLPQKKDVSNLITNFMSNSPFISAIKGSKLQLSGQVCSFTVHIFGRDSKIDFCRPEVVSALNIFGSILTAVSGLIFLFIAFG